MATNIGNKNLKVWLNFQRSPTEDLKGNTWTSHGNPTIGTANAISGNALQLDGQSYIKLSGIDLGGQDFYIDGWVYVDPASPNYARIITVVNPTNGYHMFSLRKSPNDSSKLDIWINKTADVSVDQGYSSSESDTASVGQLVHFKLIYRPDVYNFVLCINDNIKAYVINSGYCPQYTRQKFDVYIGALPNGTEGLIGSIDELRIYDGTWFSYNYGNVPTSSDYNSVYFNADIKTDIHNALSEWRYENPGTADLLTTSGTTVTGLTPTQSKTGTAFYQTERAKCFDIPATKDIWIKCDVYCNLNDRWRIYNGGTAGSTGLTSQTTGNASLFANGTNVKQFTSSSTIKQNQLQTVLLHMVSDSSAGIVEVWLDGTKLYTYTGNVNNGDAFADIYLQSDGAGTFFSNVIISNAPLNLDEDVDLHTYLTVDLARSTSNAVTSNFDTSRSLVTTQTVNADTSRNTSVATSLNADSMRNVSKALATSFDTARKVANAVNVNLDTARELAYGFKESIDFRADSVRNVSNALNANIDTARTLTGTITVSADTSRIISVPCTVAADTLRIVNVWRYENYGTADLLSVEGTTVDNLDKSQAIYKTAFYQTEWAKCFDIPSTKEIWIKCDVYCNLTDRWRMYNGGTAGSTGLTSQTSGEASLFANGTNVKQFTSAPIKKNQLQTVLLHMVSDSSSGIVEAWVDGTKLYTYTGNVNNGDALADIYLQSDGAGTFFSNVIISPVEIGLNENTTLAQNVNCDLLRFFPSTCLVSLDTARNVLCQAPLNIDTCRFVTHSVLIYADIQSTVIYAVQFNCDAIRTLPHDFILSPVEDFGGVPDTSNDAKALTQSIEIRLNEQSLTDEVVLVTVRPVDIMEQVKGQYLDYKYNMRVETCKQRGILNTCTCCSDIDEILYKQLEYTIPEDECWHNVDTESSLSPSAQEIDEEYALASTHIQTIANIIGKTPVFKFADFISTVDITAGGTTYNDLIRSIFGWTARIPQMMINCYLRDDKLFVVQRGHEANVIDFSHLKIDFAGIDREVKRTIWGSKPWAKTEVNEIRGLPWKNLITAPWSEKSNDNTVYTYYTDGLVWTATTTNGNLETVTTYYYHSFDNNGRRCLTEEITEVFENKKLIDRNITYHNQLGQGQKHILSKDADGEYLGSVMGNSNGDDRVTPYSAYTYINGQKQAVIAIQHGYDKIKQERTLYGISSFDTSFPVHGDDKLIEITKAIKWLNRRTQETVTLNLFDYPHVLDFNDRLVFNGNYYFLKSNTALKTQRIVNKQTVAMVRWY